MRPLIKFICIFVGIQILILSGLLVAFPSSTLSRDVMAIFADAFAHRDASTLPYAPSPSVATTTDQKIPIATPVSGTVSLKKPIAPVPPPKTPPAASTPGPLRATNSTTGTASGGLITDKNALNPAQIIVLTNAERAKEGLPPLAYHSQLTEMSSAKAMDMISKQYFAHVSPDGTDVGQLADNAHYVYANLGENLALGDFDSSADVVLGWMNSPGHRANILNATFTEIGVAAIMGNYEGRMVWYSVQEFGRPRPICPKPDTTLEQTIAGYEAQTRATEATLAELRKELETEGISKDTYNAKAKEYNALIESYNSLVTILKAAITQYNAGVQVYNICIKS